MGGICCTTDKTGLRKYLCCGRQLETISKPDFLEQADSGDVILIDQLTISSSWKCLTRSEFNHVGIIINTPRGIKFLVEAIAPEVIAWKLDSALSFWLSEPSKAKHVVWRQLSGVERTKALNKALFEFSLQMQGRPYENRWHELAVSVFLQDRSCYCCRSRPEQDEYKDVHLGDCPDLVSSERSTQRRVRSIVSPDVRLSSEDPDLKSSSTVVEDMMADMDHEVRESTQALFCSELVALFYQQAGWMDRANKPHHYLPKDFADYDSANATQHLVPGIGLGPMVLIQQDPVPVLETVGTSQIAVAQAPAHK
eukprot:TRINITY_DN6185_c0_g1_i2.p1 TRINITY_DN6185_c0_g1~~TRINITY_DN6185_c0_g1_i2.p1  ORF type:complete len:310 (+),score=66.23 TRINITY_DN6185_c0_g1_i2:226-1155(+)